MICAWIGRGNLLLSLNLQVQLLLLLAHCDADSYEPLVGLEDFFCFLIFLLFFLSLSAVCVFHSLLGDLVAHSFYFFPPLNSFLLRGILKNYIEEPKKNYYKNNFNYQDYNVNNESGLPPQENVRWYNELCRINPVISNHAITLQYIDKYIYKDNELILKLPFIFKSAYATMAKNALDYFNEKHKDIPFNLLDDFTQTEINGIKMSKKEIEKTNDFAKSLTMENIVSYYSNDTISSLDYIFYYSKNKEIKVARILKTPDLFKLCFDIGYMPNEIFPSDHLSIATDLILC